MRHSNIYMERSLGIYAEDQAMTVRVLDQEGAHEASGGRSRNSLLSQSQEHEVPSPNPLRELGRAVRRTFGPSWHGIGAEHRQSEQRTSRIGFVSQQIHGQLAHDIWCIVLAVFVITTVETAQLLARPVSHSVFNVVFEAVSAYGCVGLSIGVPEDDYSFSGSWRPASKLVLCLVMLRGRHRGLPVALDRAVRLPGEEMHREEEEDHRIRRSMSRQRLSLEP